MNKPTAWKQVLTAGLLALSLLFPPLSADAAGAYQADPATGCKMWNPRPEAGDGFAWSGDCKDGYAEGNGVVEYFSADRPVGKYEGTMVKGKRSGKGVATWDNGNRYEGDWLDDQMHGKGLMKAPNGASYEGDWRYDNMHGRGVFIWADGTRYEGDWAEGYMQGSGVMKLPDGRELRGRFEKDKFIGP